MILEKEFNNVCNKMGLIEDTDLDIARIVWTKAELAMQGKPLQSASLLTKPFTPKESDELTYSEAQYLKTFLAGIITIMEDKSKEFNVAIQKAWEMADADEDTELSREAFKALNKLRDDRRYLRKYTKKFSEIQRKLKKYK
jgi:hypothetical protein